MKYEKMEWGDFPSRKGGMKLEQTMNGQPHVFGDCREFGVVGMLLRMRRWGGMGKTEGNYPRHVWYAMALEPRHRSYHMRGGLSFKKGADVIKYAFKRSGGWMHVGWGGQTGSRETS